MARIVDAHVKMLAISHRNTLKWNKKISIDYEGVCSSSYIDNFTEIQTKLVHILVKFEQNQCFCQNLTLSPTNENQKLPQEL
jgi:hypothetical protein